jgi:CheY-like chemotaxis protein
LQSLPKEEELAVAQQKILVIDDSKVIRMRVKEMLPAGAYEILEAKDGEEAMNLIRQTNPNLIMLDFLLPKMSGWEVFQEIQKDPNLYKIPLVLMSGRKEEVTEKIPEPFEFHSFVEKPFEKNQLVAAIREAIAASKKPRPQPKGAAAPAAPAAPTADISDLQQKVTKLEAEVENLKKQLVQLATFVKQRVK